MMQDDYYESLPSNDLEQSIANVTNVIVSNEVERVTFKKRTQFLASSYIGEQAALQGPWVQVHNSFSCHDDIFLSKNDGQSVEKDSKVQSRVAFESAYYNSNITSTFGAETELSILPEPKPILSHREFDFEIMESVDDDLHDTDCKKDHVDAKAASTRVHRQETKFSRHSKDVDKK